MTLYVVGPNANSQQTSSTGQVGAKQFMGDGLQNTFVVFGQNTLVVVRCGLGA